MIRYQMSSANIKHPIQENVTPIKQTIPAISNIPNIPIISLIF